MKEYWGAKLLTVCFLAPMEKIIIMFIVIFLCLMRNVLIKSSRCYCVDSVGKLYIVDNYHT